MSFFVDLPLRDFVDHIMRHMLETSLNLRDTVAQAYPHLVDRMDFNRAVYEKREFLMEDWRKRECDLFVRVPFRVSAGDDAERWILICILLEHQSSPDAQMPLRTLIYAVSYWEREWKQWQEGHPHGQPLVLTPVLPLVFYTGADPWNAGRSLAHLFPEVPELRVFVPDWSPLLWNLSEQNPETLLTSASAWIQALTVVRTEGADLAEFETVFRQVCRSLDLFHQSDRMRALDLLHFVLSWITRRRPEGEVQQLRQALRESLTNPTTQQEVEAMGSKLGPTIEDNALRRGGLLTTRANLLLVLEARCQSVPEPIVARINSCEDITQLQRWLAQAARLNAIEEFHPD